MLHVAFGATRNLSQEALGTAPTVVQETVGLPVKRDEEGIAPTIARKPVPRNCGRQQPTESRVEFFLSNFRSRFWGSLLAPRP